MVVLVQAAAAATQARAHHNDQAQHEQHGKRHTSQEHQLRLRVGGCLAGFVATVGSHDRLHKLPVLLLHVRFLHRGSHRHDASAGGHGLGHDTSGDAGLGCCCHIASHLKVVHRNGGTHYQLGAVGCCTVSRDGDAGDLEVGVGGGG